MQPSPKTNYIFIIKIPQGKDCPVPYPPANTYPVSSAQGLQPQDPGPSRPAVKAVAQFCQTENVGLLQLEQFIDCLHSDTPWLGALQSKEAQSLWEAISVAVIRNVSLILQKQEQNPANACQRLLTLMSQQERILKQTYTFQLFLALVELRLAQFIAKTLPQLLQYLPTYVHLFGLCQKYANDNEHSFQTIRGIVRVGHAIMSLMRVCRVPTSFPDFVEGKQLHLMDRPCDALNDKENQSLYYSTLQKYILIDPDFRGALLVMISELFFKSMPSDHILGLFRIAVSLANKKLFEEYETGIMELLVKIKNSLTTVRHEQNLEAQFYSKMVFLFLADQQKKSSQFLFKHKSSILKLGNNEQTTILIFSLYYEKIFTGRKFKEAHIDIFNKLIQWNIKYGMIPPDKFIPELVKIGVDKLNQANERLIYGSSSELWNPLVLKIVENKCREFSEGNLNFESILNENCFNESVEVYSIYTKMFIQVLTSVEADSFKAKLGSGTLGAVVLHQNIEIIKKIREYSFLMFEKAKQNRIHDFMFVEPFCLLNSLLEVVRTSRLDERGTVQFYYRTFYKLQADQMIELISYLKSIFDICKSAFTLFLVLICAIIVHSKKEIEANLRDKLSQVLQAIAKTISIEGYAKIVSHHAENVKLLILLTHLTDSEHLNRKGQQIISNWAALVNKAEVQILLYQFDLSLYKNILDSIESSIDPQKDVQKFIKWTMNQLLLLLKHPQCLNCSYFCHTGNCINYIPIRHSNHKNSLMISFKVLVNPRMCCNSTIEIYGTPRVEGLSGAQKHRIVFKNRKILFYNRMTKQTEGSFEEVQDELYNKPFAITMEFQNSLMVVNVNKNQLISKKCDFLVDSIRFDLNGDLMIKDFKWQRFDQQQKTLLPNQSFQIFPSDSEIKITKCEPFNIKNFQEKVSLQQICVYLGQIAKSSYRHVSLNQFYGSCCEIVLNKEGKIKNEFSMVQFAYVRKLFKIIFKLSEEIAKLELPDRAILDLNLNTKKCYDFLTACIISEPFLAQSTKECKLKVLHYLGELLFSKKSDFRLTMENRKIRLFANLCKSMQFMERDLQEKYCNLVEKMVLTHEANQTLLKKISFIFSLAYGNKYEFANLLLISILQKIFSVFNHSQSEQNYHIKLIGKYFLSQHKSLRLIFLMCSMDIKIKILYSMIDDEQLSAKCYTLFQDLSPTELLELSGWLIVYSKQTMLEIFQLKKYKQHNVKNLLFLMKQITIVYAVENDESHREVFIELINIFILKSVKMLGEKHEESVIKEIKNFYSQPTLVQLIGRKIEKYQQSQIKDKYVYSFLTNYFDKLFSHLPKYVILKALQEFRKMSDLSFECFKFIIQLDNVEMLPIRALSAFLQYIIEVLYVAKRSEETHEVIEAGQLVSRYIEKLVKNYGVLKGNVSRPFLYSFPKLQKKVDFNNPLHVNKTILRAKETKFYEIKGGIYLKLIVITFHLMQALPECDFSYLITFVMEKIGQKGKVIEPVYRAVSDFIQVSKETRTRSSIDMAFQEVQQQHQRYYQNEEEYQEEELPIVMPIRKSNSKVDVDTDLTPFFIDYFFMKMFQYLETHCKKDTNQQQIKVCEVYSKMILSYLKKFEHISEEMSEKNNDSIIKYQTVEDLFNLLEVEEDITVSDRMNSPSMSFKKIIGEDESLKFGFAQINNTETDNLFIGSTPKKEKERDGLMRRKSINFDFTSGKKKKKELLANVESNIYAWSEEAFSKKIHRFFRDESKEILFHELLHRLFILLSSVGEKRQPQKSKGKHIIGFLKDNGEGFLEEEKCSEEDWWKICDQVRKVYKFTAPVQPNFALQRVQFPNISFPFVRLETSKAETSHNHNHNQNQLLSPAEISNMMNVDTDISLNSPQPHLDTLVCMDNQDEANSQQNLCEVSYHFGVYFCSWKIEGKDNKVVFTTKTQKKVEGKGPSLEAQRLMIRYGSPQILKQKQEKKIQLAISQIHEIFFRKYNQIRNASLQFFLKNGTCFYVIFYNEKKTKGFLHRCQKSFPQFRLIKIVQNYIKAFQSEGYTDKWVAGELSNFDYLMQVNKYAGRSSCDLTQYYVFPWVLEDYTSDCLDISNPKTFRDLKKPIGALRQQKLNRYLQKLTGSSIDENGRRLYGSHYSTSLFVFYYMVRIEPFTSLHIDMQSGAFDAPDRLFSSVEQMWECLMSESSTSDIKEAIPEFYYFPTFLKNINSLNLGKKQNGIPVDSVQLPPWASSPADFILKMRACLESDYVSSHLHSWIDLIFGKDQDSMEKFNVFQTLAYVENMHPDRIALENLSAIISQIYYFGQNPYALFNREHPKKKAKLNSVSSKNINLYTSLDLSLKESTTTVGTSVNQIWEEQNLDLIYYVSGLAYKTKTVITLKISGISKSSPTRTVELDMENTIHSLVRAIQKNDTPSMKRLLSQNNIEIPEDNLNTWCEVDQNEIRILLGISLKKAEVAKSIRLTYNFHSILYNQIVFVAFGHGGLRVYDWDLDVVWEFSNEFGEVSQCYLEHGVIFFMTCNGKLFLYDFLGNFKELIFEYAKPTYNVLMLVYPERKYVTKKNQNSYKIVLVGDRRKIILLHYTHRVGRMQAKF